RGRRIITGNRADERRTFLRTGHRGHRLLMIPSVFAYLEGRGHVENNLAVLSRRDAPRGEGPAVPHVFYVIHDRDRRVAAQDEIHVRRMHMPVRGHRALGGHKRLSGYLTAVDTGHRRFRRLTASEQSLLKHFQIEKVDEFTHCTCYIAT